MTAPDTCLDIEDLSIDYDGVTAVSDVTLSVGAGEIVGVIGESGSGKSSIALALLGLLPQSAGVAAARMDVAGTDMIGIGLKELGALRGQHAAMVFQEPMSALNPVMRIGDQIAEPLLIHGLADKRTAPERALELLRMVQVPEPELRMKQFPHQLSGGLRQRVVIAIAMACNPRLLIADEPTTALDVTVQAQVLTLLDELRRRTGTGVLLISHDLGVIAQTCDRVVVMYAGQVVEQGRPADVLADPAHPYTAGLIQSIPRVTMAARTDLPTIPGTLSVTDRSTTGCRFRSRCHLAQEECAAPQPLRQRDGADRSDQRTVRCVRSSELTLSTQEVSA